MKLICLLSISIILFLASGVRSRLVISGTIEKIVSDYKKAVKRTSITEVITKISIKEFLTFFVCGKPVVNAGNLVSGHQVIIRTVGVMTCNLTVYNKCDII